MSLFDRVLLALAAVLFMTACVLVAVAASRRGDL